MKKLLIIALTTIVTAALVIPASAVTNEFGGYWRTRMINLVNQDTTDTGSAAKVDTRTRLYYTAKFNENFKFVNKFEFNTIWGDGNGGDIGADGTGIFAIKNSYADFSVAKHNFKVGTQAAVLGRGLMFDDDFSGITATCKAGKNAYSLIWMKAEDDIAVTDEKDQYALTGSMDLGGGMMVSPFLTLDKQEGDDKAIYTLGTDFDMKMGSTSIWATLALNTGEESATVDNSGYALIAGADTGMFRAKLIYATGDDASTTDENEGFEALSGQCYYWAEFLGNGIIDVGVPGAASVVATLDEGKVTNLLAIGVGATLKPMKKLTVKLDLWFAQLAEDDTNGDADLGTEFDVVATYAINKNINLDLIAAYVSAGDALNGVATTASPDEDPVELGAQLSFSF